MKRFECLVTRKEKCIVEIDETIMNEEWMKKFRKDFYNVNTLRIHAEAIAKAAVEGDVFIEGYGVPKVDGHFPYYDGKQSTEDIGVNVIPMEYNAETDVKSKEIE